MKIHEYQAKEILKKFGVEVPVGEVATTPDEAVEIYKKYGFKTCVIKAQVHAGGRGKAGGVKLAHSEDEVREIASKMIGMKLVTHQTGPEGKIVRKVLIEEGMEIEKEFYAGIVLDRGVSKNVFMVSTEGGVEIEEVAKKSPEKIIKEWIDPEIGFRDYQARNLAFALGLSGDQFKKAVKFFKGLYEAYLKSDASLAEINPLVLTKDGRVLALDAKINLDDNALFRHPDLAEYRDIEEEDPFEVEASKYNLNYVKMEGNIGCMVNGAGLAMATMDIIKYEGGEPANFLDVGGGASAETVEQGFRIILKDPNVKAIFINIFGGIVRGDRVAKGVVEAAKKVGVKVPVVVRLEGTNAEEGMKILKESGLNIYTAKNIKEGAQLAVKLAKGEQV